MLSELNRIKHLNSLFPTYNNSDGTDSSHLEELDPDILTRTLVVALVGQVILFSLFRPDMSQEAIKQIDNVIDILVDGISTTEDKS